ncbi:hypothetical protein [Pseudomonas luteola]|uniref:hypothetical protein n=1 Tax=Pseudomonas luteola TaxID=47886 RepID=UPI0011BFB8DD|nr:hypothetical protein [Pseudomonas luteola]
MTGVQLGRNTGTLQDLAQQAYQTAGVQSFIAQVPPVIQASAASDTGDTDPVEIGLYRKETFQGRCVMARAEVLPISLALRQEQAHPSTG